MLKVSSSISKGSFPDKSVLNYELNLGPFNLKSVGHSKVIDTLCVKYHH